MWIRIRIWKGEVARTPRDIVFEMSTIHCPSKNELVYSESVDSKSVDIADESVDDRLGGFEAGARARD